MKTPAWSRPVSTVPFPHMLKFHKVAGTFLNQALWHNIQRGQLAGTWRDDVCGEFTVHYGNIYEHNSLGMCSLTPSYKVITLLRRPINKMLSALYWYAPESALASRPWTVSCANWTSADVAKMIDMYETDFQAPGMKYHGRIPSLNEYTKVFSYPDAPNRAKALIKLNAPDLIVGITEEMDATFVLVALMMGWRVESMLPCYSKGTCKSKSAGLEKGNVNQGKYASISKPASDYIESLVGDDNAIYAAGLTRHMEQRTQFPKFDEHLKRFRGLASQLKTGVRNISSIPHNAHR